MSSRFKIKMDCRPLTYHYWLPSSWLVSQALLNLLEYLTTLAVQAILAWLGWLGHPAQQAGLGLLPLFDNWLGACLTRR